MTNDAGKAGMTNDEDLMTNEFLMTKKSAGNFIIWASSFFSHSDLGISHYLLIAILLFSVIKASTQQTLSANATDFTSVEYWPAPDQTQVKMRLSGGEAAPLPGGLLVIKQFKLELFSSNGVPQVVVNAPECTYDSIHGQANSPGELFVQNGDGKIQIHGVGFLWRQEEGLLIISNDVKTVIDNKAVAPKPGQTGQKMP